MCVSVCVCMNGCSFVCVCAFGRYMRVCVCVQKLLKGDTFVCAEKKESGQQLPREVMIGDYYVSVFQCQAQFDVTVGTHTSSNL